MWPGSGAAAQADDHAASMRVPVGRAKADKGGDEDHSAGVGNAGGKGFDVGRGADELEVVAQPLDDRATDEDAAFEGVFEAMTGRWRRGW